MEAAKTHLVQPGAVFWAYLVGLKEMGFAILGVAQKNRNACGINQIRIAFHIYTSKRRGHLHFSRWGLKSSGTSSATLPVLLRSKKGPRFLGR